MDSILPAGEFSMTIRELAKDLYRLQQEIGILEKRLEAAPQKEKSVMEQQLRQARAERDRLRRILDGQLDR